jgi:hypothetical protein
MSERIIAPVMISQVVWGIRISKKLKYMFWHRAGYQLISLSEHFAVGRRERVGYCPPEGLADIETRMVGGPMQR